MEHEPDNDCAKTMLSRNAHRDRAGLGRLQQRVEAASGGPEMDLSKETRDMTSSTTSTGMARSG